MRIYNKFVTNLFGLTIALLMVGTFACVTIGAGGSDPFPYLEPEVSISHKAKLNQPFTVTGKATAKRMDLVDAQLWLNVTGAVLLEGEDRWIGPLKQGESKEIEATYAFVVPGEREISARVMLDISSGRGQTGLASFPLNFMVAPTSSGQDLPTITTEPDRAAVLGWPAVEPSGNLLFTDTGLLLNRDPGPRIEVIDSEVDLRRLQREGLIPEDLRHEWWWIDPTFRPNFSKSVYIAYYDAPRPAPGQLILMGNQGTFTWGDGKLHTQLKSYGLPTESVAKGPLTSAVAVYRFRRTATPTGLPNTPAFQGAREFEFEFVGTDVLMSKTESLQQSVSGN